MRTLIRKTPKTCKPAPAKVDNERAKQAQCCAKISRNVAGCHD